MPRPHPLRTVTFPDAPLVRVLGERSFRLMAPYRYEWRYEGGLYEIQVPEGFEFDGASVPRIARVWLGPWSLGLGPPLVHDWIYLHAGELPEGAWQFWDRYGWRDVANAMSRRDADRLFGRMMREKGIPQRRRRMAYRAVRVGGWWPWIMHSREMRR